MSKKHFIALADAIKNSTALITLTQVQIEALRRVNRKATQRTTQIIRGK